MGKPSGNTGDSEVETMKRQLAGFVLAFIERKKLNPSDAARELGVPRPKIYGIQNGDLYGISLELLLKLALRAGASPRLVMRAK